MINYVSQTLFLDISVLQILLLTLVMIAGATLQASAGFGSGLVAVPLLGLIDPRLVPGPILFAYLFLCAFMAWQERQHITLFHQKHLIAGLFFGTLLSLLILSFISVNYFPVIAALFVLLGVALSFFQKEIALKASNLFLGGSISGLMSTLAGLSGPPMALLLQFQSAAFIRANLSFAFIFASLFSISALLSKQLFSLLDIGLGFLLVPGMFIGFLLGRSLSAYLQATHSRYLIIVISSLSAVSLLIKSI